MSCLLVSIPLSSAFFSLPQHVSIAYSVSPFRVTPVSSKFSAAPHSAKTCSASLFTEQYSCPHSLLHATWIHLLFDNDMYVAVLTFVSCTISHHSIAYQANFFFPCFCPSFYKFIHWWSFPTIIFWHWSHQRRYVCFLPPQVQARDQC